MAPIVLLILSLVIGLVLRRINVMPQSTPAVLNHYIIYVALPSLVLVHVPGISLQADLLFPVLTCWIIFLAAPAIFAIPGKWLNWSRETKGCILLTAGLGNTAFVGYPVVEALYGSEGLQIALLVDQPGSFLVLSTLGVLTAGYYAGSNGSGRDMIKQIIVFPPVIFFIGAVAMNISGLTPGGLILDVLESLATTLTPIALISVGFQLEFNMSEQRYSPLVFGLMYKLLLAPFIIMAIFVFLFGREGLAVNVSVVMAAMPPMVTGSILAMTYGLNPRLASLMVGIGVPLSALTLAFWYLLLS